MNLTPIYVLLIIFVTHFCLVYLVMKLAESRKIPVMEIFRYIAYIILLINPIGITLHIYMFFIVLWCNCCIKENGL
jgi:hypothetical protein